jgi:hypothetical protein
MLIISGRYGTVVSYLRLMFWTPSPTDETSSLPSLLRPIEEFEALFVLFRVPVCALASFCEAANASEPAPAKMVFAIKLRRSTPLLS